MLDRARVATDEQYREEQRYRCQTDLVYLGQMLGYTKLDEEIHGPVADVCVKKKPRLPIEEQEPVKEGLHLDPRGTFKSTGSIVDSVQWIICFPNVRICKLTATKPLATAIANEIRNHFVHEPHDEPTDFQLLFPEFCIHPRDAREGEYTAPCRTRDWREKTVMSFSIETSISGWHFDVMDPDDVVDTQNSSTPQGIEKVKKNWRINRKTLMPWGYVNFKGTRYNPFDLWGDILDRAHPRKIRILVRPALKLKSGARLEPGEFPAESAMDIYFAKLGLTYDFLKAAFEEDYPSFMTQYMNDAYGGNEVIFKREEMLAATDPEEKAPVSGQVEIAWRFSYSGKPGMKTNCGVVGMVENGRMTIIDMVRGSFKPSALAHQVVKLAKTHGQHRVKVERTPGAEQLEPHIKNYAATMQWPIEITWLDFEEDDGLRELRIKSTEPLVTTKRLRFSEGIRGLGDLYRQFCNIGMVEENEIVDVVERVAQVLPRSIVTEDLDREQDLNWKLAQERDMFNRTHGLGQYAPLVPVEEEKPYSPPDSGFGLPDVLGGLRG